MENIHTQSISIYGTQISTSWKSWTVWVQIWTEYWTLSQSSNLLQVVCSYRYTVCCRHTFFFQLKTCKNLLCFNDLPQIWRVVQFCVQIPTMPILLDYLWDKSSPKSQWRHSPQITCVWSSLLKCLRVLATPLFDQFCCRCCETPLSPSCISRKVITDGNVCNYRGRDNWRRMVIISGISW